MQSKYINEMGRWKPLSSPVDLWGESQNIGAKKKYLELCQNFMGVLNREERDEL